MGKRRWENRYEERRRSVSSWESMIDHVLVDSSYKGPSPLPSRAYSNVDASIVHNPDSSIRNVCLNLDVNKEALRSAIWHSRMIIPVMETPDCPVST